MRMQQYRGLNPWARELVLRTEKAFVSFPRKGTRRSFSRWDKVPVARIKVIGFIPGYYMEDNFAELRSFEMPDGKVYVEYRQKTIHSGGPVAFTALKDASTGKPVPESLWTEQDFNEA